MPSCGVRPGVAAGLGVSTPQPRGGRRAGFLWGARPGAAAGGRGSGGAAPAPRRRCCGAGGCLRLCGLRNSSGFGVRRVGGWEEHLWELSAAVAAFSWLHGAF